MTETAQVRPSRSLSRSLRSETRAAFCSALPYEDDYYGVLTDQTIQSRRALSNCSVLQPPLSFAYPNALRLYQTYRKTAWTAFLSRSLLTWPGPSSAKPSFR